jgi:flagellum-specific peptidoglycan hydrolase FlgJ
MPDINWGQLTQPAQAGIQTAQPKAQQAPTPQIPQEAPSPDSGLLSGIKALFGSNPVSQASNAINSQMSKIPQANLAQALMGQTQQQGMGQQVNQSVQGNGALSVPNVQQMAAQAFPNDPIRQQLAVAQATQESGLLGKPSGLATNQNNLFGMTGKGTTGSTTETGNLDTSPQQFASYKNPQESVDAYKKLITTDPRYQGVLQAKNFNDAADAVAKAGYATDPHYANSLKSVNDQLSHIKTVSDAHDAPTPNIQTGVPVPPEMAKTPAFSRTMQAYHEARTEGTTKSPYVVSVDYSQPATAKRLSVINAETGKIVLQSEVAQGKDGFSNTPGSHQSSLGTFQTTQTYNGQHGQSLKVKGLDAGVNDNVEKRDVVVHGADYIGNGKTGHSFGCFAVPNSVAPKLINLIKDGTIIHAYADSSQST